MGENHLTQSRKGAKKKDAEDDPEISGNRGANKERRFLAPSFASLRETLL